MPQRIHSKEILNELLRIWERDLKVSLNLNVVQRGRIEWMPTPAVSNMANGIWATIDPNIHMDRVLLPGQLELTYNFRVIHVRKIATGEDVDEKKMDDINTIFEHMIDNFRLPDLTLSNGQVLWCLPVDVAVEPPEDAFVASIASDLTATAFSVECRVRTRRE